MANEQNLLKGNPKYQFKPGEKQREIAMKGAEASREARARRKRINESVLSFFNTPLDAQKIQALEKTLGKGNVPEDATMYDLLVAGQAQSAIKGNTKAFQYLTEMAEKSEKKEAEKPFKLPADMLGKAFVDINRQIQPNIDYVFKGGRGALKSSFISLKIIELLKNNFPMHACVVRKVGSTLKDSVYAQLKWAINELGIADEFDYKVSPAEITYKKTGQKIFFRGCDDPIKLKSIKPEFGYIGILWIEERDQLAGSAEERSVKQSILRGGDVSYGFYSYNPPKSANSWVNKEELIPDAKRVIHSSMYLDAPREWLGQKFIDDADHLKEVNYEAYEHEYLGVPNGQGGQVFSFVECRTITDEEIKSFDRIYQGVDWGWYPDPFAFVRVHYDTNRDTIYFIDEYRANKTPNIDTATFLLGRGYNDFTITCDSAEPKSINDFKDMGLGARPAIKGVGSVEYGMKFLAGRKIVFDPARTPNAMAEFVSYEYEKDKDGNVISGYPDKDNHFIDATRYALEKFYNSRGTSA